MTHKHEINWFAVSSVILKVMGERGWEPVDLIACADVSSKTVYRLLDGQPINMESLLTVCDALRITPDLALGYAERKVRR